MLFGDVRIEPGAVVRDSILMGNISVEAGAVIEYAIIDSDCAVGAKARIGKSRAEGGKLTVIGAETDIFPKQTVPDGVMVAAGSAEYKKEV